MCVRDGRGLFTGTEKIGRGHGALCAIQHIGVVGEPGGLQFAETKKRRPNTGARADNALQVTRPPHRGACY